MKLALRAVVVAAVALIATHVGTAAPVRMHAVPYSAFFWTPKVGLLGVGSCAPWNHHCGSGAVELTTDGGRTYRVIFRTSAPVYELQSLGAAGALARVERHGVYRTLDRGRQWSTVRALDGASFANPHIGLGFRPLFQPPYANLLRTEDAGRSWKRVHTPAKCGSQYPLLDLLTPQRAWMVCGGPGGAGPFESKAVFRTRDGGRRWRELTSTQAFGRAPRGGLSPAGLPAGISFARDGFGVIWGNGMLDVTRDGGRNWKAPRSRYTEFDVDFPVGGSAFGNGTAFALFWHDVGFPHDTWRLIATRDFGRSWHIVRTWRR